jgi:hypothetical protein
MLQYVRKFTYKQLFQYQIIVCVVLPNASNVNFETVR